MARKQSKRVAKKPRKQTKNIQGKKRQLKKSLPARKRSVNRPSKRTRSREQERTITDLQQDIEITQGRLKSFTEHRKTLERLIVENEAKLQRLQEQLAKLTGEVNLNDYLGKPRVPHG